ncbi:MAG: hypothetical protein CSA76_04940 [Spirochaetales bacterium]|nr:MAG: hypothetical protein CSA76_04940 [Spirochaetales bacterium]
MIISFFLNGKEVEIDTPPHRRVSDLLREEFQIRSLKLNCSGCLSGFCIILLNELPVHSCTLPAFELRYSTVETLEWFTEDPAFQDIIDGYSAAHIQPCSDCISARSLITEELLSRKTRPSADEAREAVNSVQCSCCSSRRLLDAILKTARIREKRLNG